MTMTTPALTVEQERLRREAFDRAGYWPNEVMWKAWCQAWDAASAEGEKDSFWLEKEKLNKELP